MYLPFPSFPSHVCFFFSQHRSCSVRYVFLRKIKAILQLSKNGVKACAAVGRSCRPGPFLQSYSSSKCKLSKHTTKGRKTKIIYVHRLLPNSTNIYKEMFHFTTVVASSSSLLNFKAIDPFASLPAHKTFCACTPSKYMVEQPLSPATIVPLETTFPDKLSRT